MLLVKNTNASGGSGGWFAEYVGKVVSAGPPQQQAEHQPGHHFGELNKIMLNNRVSTRDNPGNQILNVNISLLQISSNGVGIQSIKTSYLLI